MIILRKTLESELPQIVDLEQLPDVKDFITPQPLAEHQADFDDPAVTYLMIEHDEQMIGFIILVDHADTESVECLRIALRSRGNGFGQMALRQMETYCKAKYHARRIWLDVYTHNERAIHVYTKLGYQQFGTGEYQGKALLYLEKFLEG